MATPAWKLLTFAFLLQSFAKCDDISKSSLVFVIDDTGSMWRVINNVKQYANRIFDTVVNNEDSQIENIVLVTFNDPNIRQRPVARDRDAFKRALDDIHVYGGGDCPEYSMSGIELGLQLSLPRSQVYVFTDASAKDYEKYEQVKSLAQDKSSQIIFILTRECDNDPLPIYSLVYDKLAAATSGRVFRVWTQTINEILDWILENVKGRMAVLVKGEFPPGHHNITYDTDEHMSPDVFISVTGTRPNIQVIDPKGDAASTKKIIDKPENAVVKVEGNSRGTYTATIGSTSKTNVIVTTKTSIDFVHGFSTSTLTSIKETSTKPKPDIKSYLLIDLDIMKGQDVKLTSVQILDLDGNVLLEKTLGIIDTKTRLYATVDPFEPPKQIFNIMILGNVVATNDTIKRIGPTPLEPESAAPRILDNGKTEYTALKRDVVLRIPCQATGYPKPTITWTADGKTLSNDSKYTIKEGALIVRLPTASDTRAYTCTAKNILGEDSKTFQGIVEDGITGFDKVNNVHALIDEPFEVKCQLPHSESDILTWFYNDEIITNLKPHADTIYLEGDVTKDGNYSCRVANADGYVMDTYEVDFGFPPTFKAYQESEVVDWKGDGIMDCSVDAKPMATIQWFYDGKPLNTDDNRMTLPIAGWGQYMCIVSNVHGSVRRNYKITTSACLINNTKELQWRSPILVAEDRNWLNGETENDFFVIPVDTKLILSCQSQDSRQNSFRMLPGTTEVDASCIAEDKFLINGKSYKYSDLKCDRDMKPQVKRTGEQCLKKDTEWIQVGYQLKEFIEVYRVCFDVAHNVPLYSHARSINYNEFTGSMPTWFTSPGLESRKKNSYTCKESSTSCCIARKQLVDANAVAFGAAQRSTFIENLNTVPAWQSCEDSRTAWTTIEMMLQTYTYKEVLGVWSGASRYVEVDAQMMPQYLWKVVKFDVGDPIAIIFVNDPNPKDDQILCKTVCPAGKGLRVYSEDKYTYCCKLNEFSKALDIPEDVFNV